MILLKNVSSFQDCSMIVIWLLCGYDLLYIKWTTGHMIPTEHIDWHVHTVFLLLRYMHPNGFGCLIALSLFLFYKSSKLNAVNHCSYISKTVWNVQCTKNKDAQLYTSAAQQWQEFGATTKGDIWLLDCLLFF